MSAPARDLADMAQCPNCGARISGEESACPACGAPIAGDGRSEAALQQALRDLIENANQRLAAIGSGAAESAFGMSCSLGALLSAVALLIAFAAGMRDWISLAILALAGLLLTTAAAAMLASRAKSANIESGYRHVVKPEIESFLRTNRLTRREFDELADALIASDDPLRNYLTLPARKGENTPPEE